MIRHYARTASRLAKIKTCQISRYLSPAQNEDVVAAIDVPPIPYDMLSWGTVNKGSIPVKNALEEGRRGVDGGGAAANLLNRGGAIIDHPQIINLGEAFGIGKLTGRLFVRLLVFSFSCV